MFGCSVFGRSIACRGTAMALVGDWCYGTLPGSCTSRMSSFPVALLCYCLLLLVIKQSVFLAAVLAATAVGTAEWSAVGVYYLIQMG